MEENNLLRERIASAPEQVRQYLKDGRWISVVKDVCQKNNLSQEQASSLENEVLFVLIGLDVQNNFPKNIEQNLKVSPVLANDISKEFQNRVFSGLKAFLPSEIEEEPFSILINQGEKLIEDAAGNKDNVIPTPIKQMNPGTGSFQKTISSQTPNAVAPATENVVLKKQYPGQDPYREIPKP